MSPDPYHAGADRAGRRVYCSRLRNSPPPLHFTDQPRGSRNPPAFPFSALGWVAVPGRPWPHHLAAQLRGSLNFFALSRFLVSIFFLLLRCATAWLTFSAARPGWFQSAAWLPSALHTSTLRESSCTLVTRNGPGHCPMASEAPVVRASQDTVGQHERAILTQKPLPGYGRRRGASPAASPRPAGLRSGD